MDAITFDFLRSTQRAERDNEAVTELPESFLDQVAEYLARKKKFAKTIDFREFQNAKNIVDDILDRREGKLLRLAAFSSSSSVTVSHLLRHERVLFERVKKVVGEYREGIQSTIAVSEEGEEKVGMRKNEEVEAKGDGGSEDSEVDLPEVSGGKEEGGREDNSNTMAETKPKKGEPKGNETGIKIRITASIPQFMGSDLKTYGPFGKGETVILPKNHADLLVSRGAAKEVT